MNVNTVSFLLKHKLFVETLRRILTGENVSVEDVIAVEEVLECFGEEAFSIIIAVAM